MSRPSTRSISITMLLGIVAVLLLVPLLSTQLTEVGDARSRVDRTDAVIAELNRLDDLLRLAPAVMAESVAGTSNNGLTALAITSPGLVPDEITAEFDDVETTARASLDDLLRRLGTSDWVDRVAQIRADTAAGELQFDEIGRSYESLRVDAEAATVERIDEFRTRSTDLLDAEMLERLTVTLTEMSRLQTIDAARLGYWATISVPLLPVAITDVKELSKLDSYRELIITDVGTKLRDHPAEMRRWFNFSDTDAARALSTRSAAALDSGIRRTAVDNSTWNYDQFLADAAESGQEFVRFVDELSDSIGDFVDRTEEAAAFRARVFDELVEEAQTARSDAVAAQQDAFLRLFGATLIGILVVFVISRFISHPARTMAARASEMSHGDLDIEVPVQGPTEMREAATALNESIASLRLVERQSVALANGDLDHPVLTESSKGDLGTSVHRAVDRLREALSLNETFRSRLAHDAAHDGLTGLPNRKSIMEQIEAALARAERSETTVSLLFLDLDGFKAINDSHGHRTGDTLLRVVSQRIRSAIRTGDVAGRLGGDEFVVLAEGHADTTAAVELAERVRDAIIEPVAVDGVTLEPKVSIGVALATDTDLTPDELVHDADLAVYRAKAPGTSEIYVCDESLRAEFIERSNIEAAIRAGLLNDEFELHFQPTFHVNGGTVKSLEALIRWHRPGNGLVPPNLFIPVAEQSNLIVTIDEWVLETAAQQVERWNGDHDFGQRSIAVNISSRHLASETLLTTIDRVLDTYDISPHQLIIEITETAFLSDLDGATRQLALVKERGVRVALDDFGTGYMSLGVLRALPVDTLKIDQSFVQRLETADDKALVELIVGSGHILGMSITAEGVETEAQQEFLIEIGVDVIQGYHFSRPLPADDVVGFFSVTTSTVAS